MIASACTDPLSSASSAVLTMRWRSIPERGQSFTFHGFRFRVLRRERNRITALRIVAVPREAEVEEKKPKRAGTAF